MLFFIAVTLVPAVAAFTFQLICYMSYKKDTAATSTLKWSRCEALHNA